jgi:hypothetical protein
MSGAGVPTVVDAGDDGALMPDWDVSPASLALLAGGLVLVAAGISRRRRSRA